MKAPAFVSISQQLSTTEKKWFAVRTQLRCEKKVWASLSESEIEAYLPIQKYTRKWGRRIAHVEKPLINNYIFVKITRKEYVAVLDTQFVYSFVKFGDQILEIPESEISIIKAVIGEFADVEVQDFDIQEGEEIEIVGGQLTGVKAKLVEKKGRNKVLIQLNSVGFGLLVDIDIKYIRRLRTIGMAR